MIALSDKISFVLSRPVRLIPASTEEVDALIRDYYGGGSSSEAVNSMLQEFTDTALDLLTFHPGLAFRRIHVPNPPSERACRDIAARHGVPDRGPLPVSISLLPWEIQACGFTSSRKASASWFGIPTARWT